MTGWCVWLLFINNEVLGMIGIFYVSNKIPITLPLFIAMTAIARLIILQGKGMDPIILLYEAGAILIIALAGVAGSGKVILNVPLVAVLFPPKSNTTQNLSALVSL